jgi:hypothetical protein
MIFSGFFDSSALPPHARKGNAESWAKNSRRAIFFLLIRMSLDGNVGAKLHQCEAQRKAKENLRDWFPQFHAPPT